MDRNRLITHQFMLAVNDLRIVTPRVVRSNPGTYSPHPPSNPRLRTYKPIISCSNKALLSDKMTLIHTFKVNTNQNFEQNIRRKYSDGLDFWDKDARVNRYRFFFITLLA